MITEEKKACFVDEWIEINVSSTKKYYESLGYKKYRNKEGKLVFKIHPWDLSKGSHTKIRIKCTNCKKIREVKFNKFYKNISCLCNLCNKNILGKNRKVDLSGQKFGRLTVIKDTKKRQNGKVIWLCKCDCGNYCEVRSTDLCSRKTKSCGCLFKELSKQRMTNLRRGQNCFIKEDHTQEEVNKHLKNLKNREQDFNWKELSKKLRKNSCCFICGSKNNLVVHHLNGYWEFPEQRYDENNLVVLCRSCHSKYHSKYKSTKEDWEKYLNASN